MRAADGAVRLQAALNGGRAIDDHPLVPLTPRELAFDAVACAAAGADSFHVHPRDADGRETLAPETIDAAVVAIRRATRLPVGVSTSMAIETDLRSRAAAFDAWNEPDYASVNLSEPDAPDVMSRLLARGIGIETGIWSIDDVDALARSGLADRVTRVLVEPWGTDPAETLDVINAIHHALDEHGIHATRLQHSDGDAVWAALDDALGRGYATRIGLEDTLTLRDGGAAPSNAHLVRTASAVTG